MLEVRGQLDPSESSLQFSFTFQPRGFAVQQVVEVRLKEDPELIRGGLGLVEPTYFAAAVASIVLIVAICWPSIS